jgi:glyoxylase-like metal-dependent hydrolase (beta-lactamase superfamily II)
MALVSCPTGSIGTLAKHDLGPASRAFPTPFEDDVFFCGFTSRKSFGAWTWLIRRKDGNVLVDSPRAAKPLLDRIEEMGGVRWMVITHGDDLADQEAVAKRFGCERVMHQGDVEDFGVSGIERVIRGKDSVALAEDLVLVPTPGHTRGHLALVHGDRVLFSGDHLWGSPARGFPTASQSFCWYSWPVQIQSVERLLDYRFRTICPGHGPVWRAQDADAMHADLLRTLADLRARSPVRT